MLVLGRVCFFNFDPRYFDHFRAESLGLHTPGIARVRALLQKWDAHGVGALGALATK